ncbi:hypothetical protein EKO04_006617 [Ascochyta lentis]|uniref:Heterokaryon incompatibility domain-containing protein n=1 Tax=Ascochyta lentis TaxID=205686 RepID=A0A8H7J2S8_9PLEO|nr:hypothetical protein EKO04_006617 [Ascochyta lentis]
MSPWNINDRRRSRWLTWNSDLSTAVDSPPSFLCYTLDSPYTPLSQEFHEIRLLELKPGSFNDDLVITLRTKRLTRKRPNYDALSYYWCKEKSPRKAAVNGKSMTIGLFLDCALRHLRNKANQTRLLWVDALCINQGDVGERNHQVQLMGNIYSSAHIVHIWLGPERAGDELVLECIESNGIPKTKEEQARLFRATNHVCRRPWFGRVWIAQELALARKEPVVHLGAKTLHWSQLHDCVEELRDVEKPGTLKGDLLRLSFRAAAYRLTQLDRIKKWQKTRLSALAFASAALLAPDSRDKVYGLLSLCTFSDGQMTLVPDYSKTTQRVFSEATYSMLQDVYGLFIYEFLPLYPPCTSIKPPIYRALSGLPSWALDLNISSQTLDVNGENKPHHFIPPEGDNGTVQPCEMTQFDIPECVRTSDDFKQFSTCGVHLGTIVETSGSALTEKGSSFYRGATALYDFYDNTLKTRSISEDAFLQVLTTNSKEDVENTQAFHEILKSRMESELDSSQWDVLQQLTHASWSIIFFTEENRVGVTYHFDFENRVCPGDVVVAFLPQIFRSSYELCQEGSMVA